MHACIDCGPHGRRISLQDDDFPFSLAKTRVVDITLTLGDRGKRKDSGTTIFSLYSSANIREKKNQKRKRSQYC